MELSPNDLTPTETYKLLIGGITPRPIAWVSSVSLEGKVNLAPFSFFTVASANPPMLCFNPMFNVDKLPKDTLRNIREQKEFVIHSVSYDDLEAMNKTCHNVGADVDEFEYAEIEKVGSSHVTPPRIKNAVVAYECKLNRIIDLGEGALSGHLVVGEVCAIHVADDAISNYRIDSDKLDSIGRMAGSDYSLTRERTQLSRN